MDSQIQIKMLVASLADPVLAPTIPHNGSSDRGPRMRIERSWRDYFTDPSMWWDNRKDKTNPKAPDFRHKISKQPLWIDGWHNPAWVKDMLDKKLVEKSKNYVVSETTSSTLQDHELGMDVTGPRYGQGSSWEMLSLEEALSILDQKDKLPSVDDLVVILQNCRKKQNLHYAKHVHAYICNNGLEDHKSICNYIIPMFVECGSMSEAQLAFDRLIYRNVFSWTSLMAGYTDAGKYQHAFNLYREMRVNNVRPSSYTFVALLKACAKLKDLDRGQEIHIEIMQTGFKIDIFVGSTLVDMYSKCGSLAKAQKVFEALPKRNVVTWNALIAGYAEHGSGQEALRCMEQMQLEDVSPDAVTFMHALKACGSISAIERGRELHKTIMEKGLEKELHVGSSLVDMYSKCGSVTDARKVFNKLTVRSIVSWSALIAGYAEHGHGREALKCYEEMELEGISSDAVVLVYLLKACGSIGDLDKGQELHTKIVNKGLERNLHIGSALVDMYAKCGSLSKALDVFAKLQSRNVVSWSALIAGYVEHGPAQEALKWFEQLKLEGICPDVFTYACVLKACGNLGAIGKGRELHMEMIKKGIQEDILVKNTLMDMYAKCGLVMEAREVFYKVDVRDVVSWNTMIKGYCMNDEGSMAVQCFEDMIKHKVRPNSTTFASLLTACSRSNFVIEGQRYFEMMRENFQIVPTVNHCTCMVVLLARSGHLHEAERFIKTMPCTPSKETWIAMLSACKSYGEAELAQRCFEEIVKMNSLEAGSYVLMANIYANIGRWDDAYKIEELRRHVGAKKKAASALIEVNNQVHEFVVGVNQDDELLEMMETLSSRMKMEGHVPNLDLVLRPISNKEKESALCGHAEKMAIAFGLLNTPQGQTLRVTKNLRMCNDCHNVSKIISRTERREIVIRDTYCIHHFNDGLCSCHDML